MDQTPQPKKRHWGLWAGAGIVALLIAGAVSGSTSSSLPEPAATADSFAPPATPATDIFNTDLSLHDGGTAVANVQQFLADEGLYSGLDSGTYDIETQNAVEAFEQQEGLPVDGYWGPDVESKASVIVAEHPDWVTQLSSDNQYQNVSGYTVHGPTYSSKGVPAGATAICRDGTYSFSMHHSGTCSYHGGVSQWLN